MRVHDRACYGRPSTISIVGFSESWCFEYSVERVRWHGIIAGRVIAFAILIGWG